MCVDVGPGATATPRGLFDWRGGRRPVGSRTRSAGPTYYYAWCGSYPAPHATPRPISRRGHENNGGVCGVVCCNLSLLWPFREIFMAWALSLACHQCTCQFIPAVAAWPGLLVWAVVTVAAPPRGRQGGAPPRRRRRTAARFAMSLNKVGWWHPNTEMNRLGAREQEPDPVCRCLFTRSALAVAFSPYTGVRVVSSVPAGPYNYST